MGKQCRVMTRQASSSTDRRKLLAVFVNTHGSTMVQKCSTCRKHKRVCRVHVRSGKCGECLSRNQRCDVRVTQSEFRRLTEAREKLESQLKAALAAQDDAVREHEEKEKAIDELRRAQKKSLEDVRIARAREQRLRQQMDLVARRADEAIAVGMREIQELEEQEAAESGETVLFEGPSDGLALNLSPMTWGAFEDDYAYWEAELGDTGVGAAGS